MTITHALHTTRFGEVQFAEEDVIRFQDGIVGFPQNQGFLLIAHKEGSPFRWLQSIERGEIAFLVVDPVEYAKDYAPEMPPKTAADLGLTTETPILVYAIANIPRGKPDDMTLNLAGPLVINAATGVGAQVVLESDSYPIRYRIFSEKTKSDAA